MADTLVVPHNEERDGRLVVRLDKLTGGVGEIKSHLSASLLDVSGVLVERYETEVVLEPQKVRPWFPTRPGRGAAR